MWGIVAQGRWLPQRSLVAYRLLNKLPADGIANLHAQFFDLTEESSPIRVAFATVDLLPQLLGKLPNLFANLLGLLATASLPIFHSLHGFVD